MRLLSPLLVLAFIMGSILGSPAVGDVDGSTDPLLGTSDDGGSGGDASDDPMDAVRLDGPGTYQGTLDELDTDWFVHVPGTTEAVCVTTAASGTRLGTTELNLDTGSGMKRLKVTGEEIGFGYASLAINDVYVGFTSNDDKGLGEYVFTDSSFTFGSDSDGSTGGDAGATTAAAASLTEDCLAGAIDATTGDTRDVYSFSGTTDDQVVLTLVQSASGDQLTFSLLAPDGTIIKTASPGTPLAHTLTTTGSYFVAVDRVPELTDPLEQTMSFRSEATMELEFTSYQIGMCRPFCLTL